jgi:polyhydroxyalkanoate synthesis regulator phasin
VIRIGVGGFSEKPFSTIFLERRKIMFDLIKKTILTGVGLAAMTKDKVEELAKELTEKGEITEKEGKELIDDLLKRSEQAKKDLETKIEKIVEKVLGKMNLASKEDISKIEKRLKRLEKKETADS